MGNQQNSTVNLQELRKTSHPGFRHYNYNHQHQLLETIAKIDEDLVSWRKKAHPLLEEQHLVMPLKIQPNTHVSDVGCYTMEDLHNRNIVSLKIFYEPYTFHLRKEIEHRQKQKVRFREIEVWKIIGGCIKGIKQWNRIYPHQRMGVLSSQNVVLNHQGKLKVVTKVSFFHNSYTEEETLYNPPESNSNSVIKYSFNSYSDPQSIKNATIYSLGIVAFQMMSFQTMEDVKKNQITYQGWLYENTAYSWELRQMIIGMVRQNQSQRPNLNTVAGLCKKYKKKFI